CRIVPFLFLPPPRPPTPTLFPYTTLFRSLRAYQAHTGLPVTGRFDLETLGALQLLPRARAPIFNPFRQRVRPRPEPPVQGDWIRSEEHTSELQSLAYLVCRLLLEKKKK